MEITSFRGKHGFLSNFYLHDMTVGGVVYPSMEHAYQAAKAKSKRDREWVAAAPSAAEAKRRGRTVLLVANWDDKRIKVMHDLLVVKFTDEGLRAKLLATRDAHLEEGNTWGDQFWGTVQGIGRNHLGKLLMQVRKELQG